MPSRQGMPAPAPVAGLRVRMRWADVAFLHWRVEAQEVEAALPAGVAPDAFDGSAWVSALAFRMRRIRAFGLPVSPAVPELNLRTYARHAGRPGIVFLAIDAPRAATLLGRAQGLPYHRARVDLANDGVDCRPPDGPRFAAAWRPRGEADAALDRFLTERYCAWTTWRGRLARVDVAHEPFPLQAAQAKVRAWGRLPPVAQGRQPDLAHWSPGVPVVCGRVRPLPAAAVGSPAPPQG
jgi:uncharacterized protein YqjF (DUF2071 family)